jgi:hypothetical protein
VVFLAAVGFWNFVRLDWLRSVGDAVFIVGGIGPLV